MIKNTLFKTRIWNIFLLSSVLLALVPTSALANAPKQVIKTPAYEIRYPIQVNQLLNQINPQLMWGNLTVLTQFPDRGADHESGLAAADWIQSQIKQMVKMSGRHDVSLFTVNTIGKDPYSGQSFQAKQPSIVVKIGRASNPGIILGAHFDTHSCGYVDDTGFHDDEGCLKDPDGPLPGANDDGSGTVTILETARVLLNSNMRFNKPIYLIFYAAEERGEWGSIATVDYFKKNNIAVDAVLQLDQTGFAYNNEHMMYLETNEGRRDKIVDDQLTHYLLALINTYVKKPVQLSCSGGSDEETWSRHRFVAARPLESDYCNFDHMYHYFHTNQDTLDKISLIHMTDYLKLAVAFSIELAEPIK